MINFVVENDWKWTHSRLPIKHVDPRNAKKDEEYYFQVINSEDTGPNDQCKIKVKIDRPLPFEPETGFVWHKSWNLPEITVELAPKEASYLREQYQEIGCEIMAVYPVRYNNSYYLSKVLLEGNRAKIVSGNQISFKFLRFGETSFNYSRNKFCLLVWVYGQTSYKDRDDLFCLISSPIYVDSRKQARKKQVVHLTNSVTHSPRRFIAPLGGVRGAFPNSSEGFIKYYGAQNIRHKIKHPFYIAYHFDRVFRLFQSTACSHSLEQLLGVLESARNSEQSLNRPPVSLMLLDINQPDEKAQKRILSILERWKFPQIELSFGLVHADGSAWKQINKDEIKESYRQYYENQLVKGDRNGKEDNDMNLEVVEEHVQILRNMNAEKSGSASEEKSAHQERERFFELRTVINLSAAHKRAKLQKKQ